MPRYFPEIRAELIEKRKEMVRLQNSVDTVNQDLLLAKNRRNYMVVDKTKDDLVKKMSLVLSIRREILKLEAELIGNWRTKPTKEK
jgi:hypothetical protein